MATMNIARMSGLAEQAANTLSELANELRQLSAGVHLVERARMGGTGGIRASAEETGAPWEGPVSSRKVGSKTGVNPLARVQAFWDGVSMAPVMTFGECRVDLAAPSGRWELLVLAVLLGARVTNRVVERTFATLRNQGLLDLERLACGGEGLRHALEEVFRTEYHALGNKAGKIEALIDNARRLVEVWDGDLHAIYLAARKRVQEEPASREATATGQPGPVAAAEHGVDEKMLIQSLQEFKHVKQLAFWVCRTLKAHGIWRDLGPWATGYHDRYTRLPLERLGIEHDSFDLRSQAGVMALYLQGYNLCSQDDVKVCLNECPVAAWCSFAQLGT